MHDFVGTQNDSTPKSVKEFIQDIKGLDITKGEGQELYDKLKKINNQHVIMDINGMFSNIYYRTTNEYQNWYAQKNEEVNVTFQKNTSKKVLAKENI